MTISSSPTLLPQSFAPAIAIGTIDVPSLETVLVIGTATPPAGAGFEHMDLRFVDPACAAALLERERPAAVVADLELLSRTPCGIELRRTLDTLVMHGQVTVTWVRNDS
jgi:hypothetical protein